MASHGSRGYFQQGSDSDREIAELGSWLSKAIHCPVHYPAFEKNVFECNCGVGFPVFVVRMRNLDFVNKQHTEGLRPDDPHYKKE